MFKIVNGVAPDYLSDLLPSTISYYNCRNEYKFRKAKRERFTFKNQYLTTVLNFEFDLIIKLISDVRTSKKKAYLLKHLINHCITYY